MFFLTKATANYLDEKAKSLSGFLNCRLFAQTLTGISAIEKQPVVKTPKVGDILWWGNDARKTVSGGGYKHVAVYAGNGQIWQVEEWGKLPEKVSLASVEAEYGKPDKIFKGSPP